LKIQPLWLKKSHIVTFIHVKSMKEISIWLQFKKNEKNPQDGADMQKNQKQILKLLNLHYRISAHLAPSLAGTRHYIKE
jgi:hypothetical protein